LQAVWEGALKYDQAAYIADETEVTEPEAAWFHGPKLIIFRQYGSNAVHKTDTKNRRWRGS
jgi:hypothetical protein